MKKRRFLFIVLGLFSLLVSYCGGSLILGVFPHDVLMRSLGHEQTENFAYQTQWEKLQVSHYRITVENWNYTSLAIICPGATLEVKNAVLVNIDAPDLDPEIDPDQDLALCSTVYQDLTLENLFKLVTKQLQRGDILHTDVAVQYDSTYGFINLLEVKVMPTLLDPLLYGDNAADRVRITWFKITITNFEILN